MVAERKYEMVTFKLITSQLPEKNIRTESEILKELHKNIDFYDDYDNKNYRNNFMEAFMIIENEFLSIKTNDFV